MNWHEIFEYNNGNLIWKIDSPPNYVKGKIAGTINNTGYYRTKVFGKKYLNHRIIFEMHHGYCPEFIDHIDRDRLNNKIENLRPATKLLNSLNKIYKKESKNKCHGVYFIGNNYYVRNIEKKLVKFSNIEDAIEYKKLLNDYIIEQEIEKLKS